MLAHMVHCQQHKKAGYTFAGWYTEARVVQD